MRRDSEAPAGREERGWNAGLRTIMSDRRRLLLVLGLTVIGVGSCSVGSAVAAWNRACAGGCPTADQIADFAPQQASILYDTDGRVLGMFYRERRQLISVEDLPRHVTMAFVSIEDRRFYDHEGVDFVRLVGAIRDNVFSGFGASGASTISMQLARNLFPEQLPRGEKTFRRKIAEARLALTMERRFAKDEILELYLNHIYLGAGAYGLEAAARTYFDKPAAELTITEAATLAGLPQAPSGYNPRRNPQAAHGRRNIVLDWMVQTGTITPEEGRAAKEAPLGLAPPSGVVRAPYFVEHIRRELEDQLGELLYTGGLRIYTTVVAELQEEAETALEEHLRQIEGGTYGAFRHPSYARFSEQHAEDPTAISHTPYLQGAVVVMEPHTGNVLAMVGGRNFNHSQFNRATQALRQPGSAFKPYVFAAALEAGRSPLYQVSDAPLFIQHLGASKLFRSVRREHLSS
jgi:membrane carboxypeptidase/penicillin-binding protein